MKPRYKFSLIWLVYGVLLMLAAGESFNSGLVDLVAKHDITHLSFVILVFWALTEIVGLFQLFCVDREISKKKQTTLTTDQIISRHSFVSFMGDIIVAVGILGTVGGVIMALLPFFSITQFDIKVIQPHLLEMFSGIAVAFFPTAFSILAKIFLDFHSKIHEMAVLALLAEDTEPK
jgi:hypothetical protein